MRLELWWAETVLMASWWLLWAGFGQGELAAWGISRRWALGGLGVLWLFGWVRVGALGAAGPIDLGLAAAIGLAMVLLGHDERPWFRLVGLALGLLAASVRALAPINPQHVTLVPWVGGEGVALGLLAAAVALEPLRAAAVAVVAAGVADGWRFLVHPVPGALAGGDWLYTVLAAVVAWSVASVLTLPGSFKPSG
jgi:hypothetical protein